MSKIKPTYQVADEKELEDLMQTISVFNKCIDVISDKPVLRELPVLVKLVENNCYAEITPERESIQEVHIANTPERRAMNLYLSIDAKKDYIRICGAGFQVIVMYDPDYLPK